MSNLVAKKDVVWEWNKHFEKPALKKCSYAEEGIVSNLENPSPFQVFTETIGLEGLLTLRDYSQNEGSFKQQKMNWLHF